MAKWEKQFNDIIKVLLEKENSKLDIASAEKIISLIKKGESSLEIIVESSKNITFEGKGLNKKEMLKYIKTQDVAFNYSNTQRDFIGEYIPKKYYSQIVDNKSLTQVLRSRAIEMQSNIKNQFKKKTKGVRSIFSGFAFVSDTEISTLSQKQLMQLIQKLEEYKRIKWSQIASKARANPHDISSKTLTELLEIYGEDYKKLGKNMSSFEEWLDYTPGGSIIDFAKSFEKKKRNSSLYRTLTGSELEVNKNGEAKARYKKGVSRKVTAAKKWKVKIAKIKKQPNKFGGGGSLNQKNKKKRKNRKKGK